MKTIWTEHGAGGYGRNKVILRGTWGCNVCGKERPCIGFDASDEEYHPIMICEGCIATAFKGGPLPTGSKDQ
jgi:hypothetical protein